MYKKLNLYNPEIESKSFVKEYVKSIGGLVLSIIILLAVNRFVEIGAIRSLISMFVGFVIFICVIFLAMVIRTNIYYDKDQKLYGSVEFTDDYCLIRRDVNKTLSKEIVGEHTYKLYYSEISSTNIYGGDQIIAIFLERELRLSEINVTNEDFRESRYVTINTGGPNQYIADYILGNEEICMKLKAKKRDISFISAR